VADIENFRLRNGINDPKRALGREAERSAQRERQRQTRRQIREANRQLGRGEFAAQRRSIERGGLSIGR
jgi:vacuolar-type H+-ATPase subunit E/Vma4